MAKFWREEEIDTLRTMYLEGRKAAEISERLERSLDSVNNQISKMNLRGQRSNPKPVAYEQPPIDEIIRETEAKLTGQQKLVVVPAYQEPPEESDMGMVWAHEEERNRRAIERAQKRAYFSAEFGDEPIGVAFISDQHLSMGNSVDMRRMMEDALLIRDTPNLYACLGGDGVDNHIKHRAAIMASRSQPGDQYKLFEFYLSVFADKILALISGNHDAWTDQIAGVDMIQQIAQRQKLAYCPAECHLDITVGGVLYLVDFRHQYRYNSTMNQGHTVKQLYAYGERAFDIGCVCHHHEPHIETFRRHSQTRYACRPGSYQITSSYSRQYGFVPTEPTCPTFILFPGERRIMPFYSAKDAAEYLQFLRTKARAV